MSHLRRVLGSALAATAVALAAAVPAGAASAHQASSFPVTVSTPYGPVTIAARPDRVISLSPTATEMLFAIGAGKQVIAVDNDSDYPASAPHSSLSGYTPNVEAIAARKPDLVVVSYNPTHPDLVTSLKLLHIPVLYLPAAANLAGTYAEISELGKVTGDEAGAAALDASMRSSVAVLTRHLPKLKPAPTYFYELDPTLYTATADTFIGSVFSLAGLRNIAGASVHGSDYPQLSPEVVLRDNPTFIFLADGASIASLAKRPGWSALSAVRDHRVIELNVDIASRWGPRIVDLLRTVVSAVRSYAAAKR